MLNLNIPLKNIPVSTLAEILDDKRTEVILYAGPNGMLRASVRAIDADKSMHPNWPYYPQDKEEKVPKGSIVKLEIGMWATGIEFLAGESIRLQISGSHQGMRTLVLLMALSMLVAINCILEAVMIVMWNYLSSRVLLEHR